MAAGAIVLYGIAQCDTVKRARAWVAGAGGACAFHDFKRDGLSEALVDHWIAAVGVQTLVNRKGTTWRRLDDAARASADDAPAARALLLAQPSLVKRPVVDWADGTVSVGFDAARFAELIARR
jgi:arsenate reductase (glutaredoxin)